MLLYLICWRKEDAGVVRGSKREPARRTNLIVWRAIGGGAFLVLEPAQNVNGGILVEGAATYNGLEVHEYMAMGEPCKTYKRASADCKDGIEAGSSVGIEVDVVELR